MRWRECRVAGVWQVCGRGRGEDWVVIAADFGLAVAGRLGRPRRFGERRARHSGRCGVPEWLLSLRPGVRRGCVVVCPRL